MRMAFLQLLNVSFISLLHLNSLNRINQSILRVEGGTVHDISLKADLHMHFLCQFQTHIQNNRFHLREVILLQHLEQQRHLKKNAMLFVWEIIKNLCFYIIWVNAFETNLSFIKKLIDIFCVSLNMHICKFYIYIDFKTRHT